MNWAESTLSWPRICSLGPASWAVTSPESVRAAIHAVGHAQALSLGFQIDKGLAQFAAFHRAIWLHAGFQRAGSRRGLCRLKLVK